MEEKGTLPKPLYEASVTLIPKPKMLQKKRNYKPITLMNINAKIFTKKKKKY